MRKAGFVRSSADVRESLPRSYRYEELSRRRFLFLQLFNFVLPEGEKIDPRRYDLERESLRDVMVRQILSFFPMEGLRRERQSAPVKIYAAESEAFLQFFALSNAPRARYLARNHRIRAGIRLPEPKESSHPAYRLLRLIFDGYGIELMVDLDAIFLRVVHERILKKNPEDSVRLSPPFIYIERGKRKVRVHPLWKSAGWRDAPQTAKFLRRELENMEEGVEHYLLLPKRQDFRRYIPVYASEEKGREVLRIVPYSFTFCDRKIRRRKHA